MGRYVERANPPLWGEDKPRFFKERMFVLAMYHGITGEGYNKILGKVEGLGFKISESPTSTTKSIRRTLKEWRKSKVRVGDSED